MGRNHEDPNPYEPTRAIVDTGIYGRTRNPIYLGLMLVMAGVAILANSVWQVVALILCFLLLRFGVVIPEERYLSRKFGASYDDYRRRVRRWL